MAYVLLKKEANILMSRSFPFLENALWLHEVGKKKRKTSMIESVLIKIQF